MKRSNRLGNHRVRQGQSVRLAGVITAGLILSVLVGGLVARGSGPARAETRKDQDAVTGKANLHPINNSGVKARMQFVDDGSTLAVTGTATDPTPFSGIPP